MLTHHVAKNGTSNRRFSSKLPVDRKLRPVPNLEPELVLSCNAINTGIKPLLALQSHPPRAIMCELHCHCGCGSNSNCTAMMAAPCKRLISGFAVPLTSSGTHRLGPNLPPLVFFCLERSNPAPVRPKADYRPLTERGQVPLPSNQVLSTPFSC